MQLTFQKRCEVFIELLESNAIAGVTVDNSKSDQLLRLLDTVVIKLEGGTDDDLKALDEKPIAIVERKATTSLSKTDDQFSESGNYKDYKEYIYSLE